MGERKSNSKMEENCLDSLLCCLLRFKARVLKINGTKAAAGLSHIEVASGAV